MPGATADPHAEDPFAAALGMDLPKWREDPGAPASRLPAAPAARRRRTPAGDADDGRRSRQPIVDQPGPSDPADRD